MQNFVRSWLSYFVTAELVHKLQVPYQKTQRVLNDYAEDMTEIKYSTRISIESCRTNFKADLDLDLFDASSDHR